jgi:8-oxo-dGTP pyrophosphatase MutT (NUDIX family)
LQWFQELAGRSSGLPLRNAVRALVLDPAGRVLMVRFEDNFGSWWSTPGGGVERRERRARAGAELVEEAGLREYELGPLIWTREHRLIDIAKFGGQRERHYLIRTEPFDPVPGFNQAALAAEGVHDVRWFTPDELESVITGPRRLASLVRDLLENGPPAEPIDAGV